jgi:SAM-dependent methyltransferase
MTGYVFDQAWELERERLAGLEGWLDPGTIRLLDAIGVGAGWRCLEVGGGGGSIMRWLCERVVPGGSVLATDLDTRFLETLEEPNLEVRHHDILTDELPADSFDLVHARCLVEHLPEPELALERMRDALKPGGIMLIEDIDFVSHEPVTPSDVYVRVRDAMTTVMQASGFQPHFGRRLPGMLMRLGLEDLEAEGRVPFGRRENNPGMANYKLALGFLREPMIATGTVSGDDIDEAARLLDDLTFELMPPTIVAAWGRKP